MSADLSNGSNVIPLVPTGKPTTKSRLQWALAYARTGLAVFPLTKYKTPFKGSHGHLDATKDPDEIKALWKKFPQAPAIGISCIGSGIVVIDPDRHPDKPDGIKSFKELEGFQPIPPSVPKALTPRKGIHLLYKVPELGEDERIVSEAAPSVDIKYAGFIVVEPSHYDALPYRWVEGRLPFEIDIPELPKWLRQHVVGPKTFEGVSFEDDAEVGEEDDSQWNRDRYVRFLEDPKRANGRYIIACVGRSYLLPAETVATLIFEHYNEKCDNDWDEDRTRQCVRNAFTYAQGRRGSMHPSVMFGAVEFTYKIEDEPAAEEKEEEDDFMLPEESEVAEVEEEDDFMLPEEKPAAAAPAKKVEKPKEKVVSLHSGHYDYTRGADGDREFKATMNNVVNFLELPGSPVFGLIRLNELRGMPELVGQSPWPRPALKTKTWSDADLYALKHFLSVRGLQVPTALVDEAASCCAYARRFHPVRDYLNGLTWDGTARLDTWLPRYTGSDDNDYVREIGKDTLISAVARVFQPGCQVDSVLVLEGRQGTGKSSAVRILGGAFYADVAVDPESRDTVANMQGNWILEMSEMKVAKFADVESIRRFLTVKEDKVRLAYARHSTELPRQTIFIGTVNPNAFGGYLTDTTGNRRFLPVLTRRIDLEGLTRDRDQLFAEAVHRYRKGESWYIPEDSAVKRTAENEQESRVTPDEWESMINEWLNNEHSIKQEFMTIFHVANQALHLNDADKLDRRATLRIAAILRKAGYIQHVQRDKGLCVRGWVYDYEI